MSHEQSFPVELNADTLPFGRSRSSKPLQVIIDDPYLASFEGVLRGLMADCEAIEARIIAAEGSMDNFTRSYQEFGIHVDPDACRTLVREWAPNARQASIFGDFNGWNRSSHMLLKDSFGHFHGTFEGLVIPHGSRIKISFLPNDSDTWIDRIPAWITRAVQDGSIPIYTGVVWHPITFTWQHPRPTPRRALKIYECHIGMSSKEPRIATYLEFRDIVLPRIKRLGYNAIQIMAIQEHPLYGSFGYQVSSFFAASSRFGTPEELKSLIDTAHSMDIAVLLDVVHSHASKNVLDGLNQYDGSQDLHYFSGEHPVWDSRLFDYGRYETLRFLLSNLRMWIDEYRFDGFRFDGVTSMLYRHHGLGYAFRGYEDYFNPSQLDRNALVYMMMANRLLHQQMPTLSIITIAEDVSGFPGLCRPFDEGGVGFDYRLAMSIPDKIEQLVSTYKDEDWPMGELTWSLSNRRWKERCIAYAESHDQALVGSKTVSFWLMDKEMYWHMSRMTPLTLIIDRGIQLHKMIRLLVHGLGGEGYLNFMGNEFGHPEWIDFPRSGNGESYDKCRRRWDLADDDLLRYKPLQEFDAAMNHLEDSLQWLSCPPAFVSCKHEDDKVIVFERVAAATDQRQNRTSVFVFNFHPTKSFEGYRIGVPSAGTYHIALDSDSKQFEGHGRLGTGSSPFLYHAEAIPWHDRPYSLRLYLPSRTAFILALA